jgi:hypothetical protein
MTYSFNHAQVPFSIMYNQLQVDEDGLFPSQRVVHDLYYLITSTQIHGHIGSDFSFNFF